MNDMTPSVAEPVQIIEAEQQLLGALLVMPEVWSDVRTIVEADHFAEPVHADIFGIVSDRYAKGHPVDVVTVLSAMAGHDGLAALGGGRYLARLAGSAISPRHARDYARLVAEKKIARDALAAMQRAEYDLTHGVEPQEAVARLQGALMALPEAEGRESAISFTSAATDALRATHDAYQSTTTMLRTGLDALDKILLGLAPSDLMLLGGATSMGKTAVAVDIARRVASRGNVVGFASLEMDPEQIVNRVVASESRIPYAMARAADEMDEATFRAWTGALGEVAGALPIHIFPRHVRDIAAIHATAQGIKLKFGRLDLVIVDYAQLCRAPGREFRERMVNVSIGLKTMAKMLHVPVIALVQLDRKLGERPDPRPQTYDIKETSQFETDADQIVFAHREYYYLERKGPVLDKSGAVTDEARADWEADKKATEHVVELIVRKNRHGRLATAKVGCHMPTNRFWNLHEAGF